MKQLKAVIFTLIFLIQPTLVQATFFTGTFVKAAKELNSNWDVQFGSVFGYWHLNGAGAIAHASTLPATSGSDLTVVNSGGGLSYANGKMLQGLSSAGTDITSYVTVSPLAMPTTQVSASLWVKTTDSACAILSYASTGADNDFLIFAPENVALYIRGNIVTSGVSVNDGEWHHLVVTWTSGSGQIVVYKDGVSSYTGNVPGGLTLTAGGSLILAQEQDSVGGGLDLTQAMTGVLDEVALWNAVLTGAEAQRIYRGQSSFF